MPWGIAEQLATLRRQKQVEKMFATGPLLGALFGQAEMGGIVRSCVVISGVTRNYTKMFGRARVTVTTRRRCLNCYGCTLATVHKQLYHTLAATKINVR